MKATILILFSLCSFVLSAQEESQETPQASAAEAIATENAEPELKWATGTIQLDKAGAILKLDEKYQFIGPSDTRKVVEDYWGNPKGTAEGALGMVFPAGSDPASSWGAILSFEEDGYINDEKAEEINYDDMLKDMQKETAENNKARVAEGYESISLVGWAEVPHYDKANHKLYWAKELSFGENPDHTLNYDVRILGRKGVLSISAIADMSELGAIKPQMEDLLKTAEFQTTHRYEDFLPGADKVAAYGLGGLIAGKLAMKAGFFALLIKLLLAGKKIAILAVVAIGVALKKFLGRGKNPESVES